MQKRWLQLKSRGFFKPLSTVESTRAHDSFGSINVEFVRLLRLATWQKRQQSHRPLTTPLSGIDCSPDWWSRQWRRIRSGHSCSSSELPLKSETHSSFTDEQNTKYKEIFICWYHKWNVARRFNTLGVHYFATRPLGGCHNRRLRKKKKQTKNKV